MGVPGNADGAGLAVGVAGETESAAEKRTVQMTIVEGRCGGQCGTQHVRMREMC